jgi:hypothetical protein
MHFRSPLYNSVTPPPLLWVSDELNNLYEKRYESGKRKCTGETTKIFLLHFCTKTDKKDRHSNSTSFVKREKLSACAYVCVCMCMCGCVFVCVCVCVCVCL